MKKIVATLAGAALMVAFSRVEKAIPILTLKNGDSSVVVQGSGRIDVAEAGCSSFNTVITPVPEPTTMMLLLGTGFFSLAIYGKRRRNA